MERYKKEFKEEKKELKENSYFDITRGILQLSKEQPDDSKFAKYLCQCIVDSVMDRKNYNNVLYLISNNLKTGNF
jgi:hypothetical protein